MRLPGARFLSGLIVGLVLGVSLTVSLRTSGSFQAWIGRESSPLLRCAADVDSSEWLTYRNDSLAFAILYPPTFTVRETPGTVVLTSTGALPSSIVLEKIRGSLAAEMTPQMRQAGWKVLDRQAYVLTTPYFTNEEDHTLSERYLFVRDLPIPEQDDTTVMVRATLTIPQQNAEFSRAREQGILDPETILTLPEQILSTFRFLQFEELPGRDSGA